MDFLKACLLESHAFSCLRFCCNHLVDHIFSFTFVCLVDQRKLWIEQATAELYTFNSSGLFPACSQVRTFTHTALVMLSSF